MSTLTEKFTELEEQVAAQALATQGYIDTVEAKLQELANNLDIIIVNNAANAKALLAAIGANSPCAPCPTPPLVVPVTPTTGTLINEDKCKRTHAFLHAIATMAATFDTIMSYGVPFNSSLVMDAIGQVITALANPDEMPLPSFPEAVNIAGNGISFIAGNAFRGGSLSGDLATLLLDMVNPIYSGTTAADDQAQYNAVIDGSALPFYSANLLKSIAYNELFAYYFDPESTPDLSGFTGTDCEFSLPDITECMVLSSANYVLGSDHFQVIFASPTYSGNEIFTAGDFFGFTLHLLTLEGSDPVLVDFYSTSDGYGTLWDLSLAAPDYTVSVHTHALGIHSHHANVGGAYTIQICPPEPE